MREMNAMDNDTCLSPEIPKASAVSAFRIIRSCGSDDPEDGAIPRRCNRLQVHGNHRDKRRRYL